MTEGSAWAELQVSVSPGPEEAIGELLFEQGCVGLHEETLPSEQDGGRVLIRAYFDKGDAAAAAADALALAWPEIRKSASARGALRMRVTDLDGDGSGESWRAWFEPVAVGERVVVAPSWWETEPPPGRVTIRIDAGTAFGTGGHETTRLCLQEIERFLTSRSGASVLDVGTGSGLLAIGAALLGAGQVLGVDVDPGAVAAARDNARENGVADTVAMEPTAIADIQGEWDLVVANLLPGILESLCRQIKSRLAPDGTLLLSGIPAPAARAVQETYEGAGLVTLGEESFRSTTGREVDRWVLLRMKLADDPQQEEGACKASRVSDLGYSGDEGPEKT